MKPSEEILKILRQKPLMKYAEIEAIVEYLDQLYEKNPKMFDI